MKYDLRTQKWISCEYQDGTHTKIGLIELFLYAEKIVRIYHENPLAEAVLMRILLALGHRILDGPRSKQIWKEIYSTGKFPRASIFSYFQKWQDRFDLFSEQYPFMQTAGLNFTDKEGVLMPPRSLSPLIPHISSGNNVTLFDHTTDEMIYAYPPEDVVFIVLVADFYALGGTFKKDTNFFGYQQNCKNGCMVNGYHIFLSGTSLFETLLLNMLVIGSDKPMRSEPDDAPYWERPVVTSGDLVPRGYFDYLTFTGRNIRLVPDEDGLVRRAHYACGRSLAESFKEPFIPAKETKKGLKKLRFSLERAMWRDSGTLFHYGDHGFSIAPMNQLKNMGRDFARKVFELTGYGFINDQAKPLSYRKETMPLPFDLLDDKSLRNRIIQAIKIAETGHRHLRWAIEDFLSSMKIDNDPKFKKNGLKSKTDTLYWEMLDMPFKEHLERIYELDYLSQWEDVVQNANRESYRLILEEYIVEKARALNAYVQGERKLYFKKIGGENL